MREERARKKWREGRFRGMRLESAKLHPRGVLSSFRRSYRTLREIDGRNRERGMTFGLPTVTSLSVAKGIDWNSAVFRRMSDAVSALSYQEKSLDKAHLCNL